MDIIKLIVCIAACEGIGGLGALFTAPAIPVWYRKLKKPSFTPPSRAFAPVWTVLYLLMGFSVFLIWREGLQYSQVLSAFIVFWFQLILNLLWSVFFFGLRSLLGGMIIIVLLWIAILICILLFFDISPLAGGLLIPYIIWVSIAASINFQLWRINK